MIEVVHSGKWRIWVMREINADCGDLDDVVSGGAIRKIFRDKPRCDSGDLDVAGYDGAMKKGAL